MNGETVADIKKGALDSTEAEILTVYAKVIGRYAVYRTSERVMVQFADDQALGAEQRLALAPLNPLLGQVNGLIDGWRLHVQDKMKAKAAIFDRRIADALRLGLQGQVTHAEALLREIKEDLLEERTSPARVNYLLVASGAALALILLACFATSTPFRTWYDYSPDGWRAWLGFGAGALGATASPL